MSRFRPFRLEQLEDRCVPANWGNPWPDAAHLTLSFVPDGTSVGGGLTSNLFQTLNATAPTNTWETTILRAIQTWAVNSNINIGLVSDDGQALGAPGPAQGASGFGDIRISAAPLSNSVVAFAEPYDPMAGTWSGDIILNSNDFNGSNPSANYDLFSTVLHEAGHVFGLPDNSNPTSVMYGNYQGTYTGLSAGDITALQDIYGSRSPDTTGSTFSTATKLNLLSGTNGVLSVGASGDLATQTAVDMYRVNLPSVATGLTIQLQDAGLSLLTPQITVYNAQGQVVGSAQSTDPASGNLTVQVNSLLTLGTYYVKVQGDTNSVFNVGSYNLTVQAVPAVNQLLGGLSSALTSVGKSLASNIELNTSFQTAQALSLQENGNGSHYHAAHQASINGSGLSDYYSVQSPPASSGDNVLTVTVWGAGSNGLTPTVTIYDANHNLVTAQVLANEGGAETLQVVGATPGATYYIEVGAAQGSPSATGSYTVSADFGAQAEQLQTFVNSTLTAQAPQASGSLVVQQSGLFHFVFGANQNTGTGVVLTITNSSGQVVQQLTANAGASISATLDLAPDTYTFTFTAFGSNGQAITPVNYTLQGARLSDPMAPQTEDTSSAPSQSPPPPAQQPPPPSTVSSTSSSNTSSPSSPPAPTGTSTSTTTTSTASPPSPPPSSTVSSSSSSSTSSPSSPPSPTGTSTSTSTTSTASPPSSSDPNSSTYQYYSGPGTESPSSTPDTV